MANYLALIAEQLGISILLLVAIFVWSTFWKFWALWKSARRGSVVWFIVFALVNTLGLLEILYIFVFSECCKKKPVRQRRRRRR